jgi:hypothetical protein
VYEHRAKPGDNGSTEAENPDAAHTAQRTEQAGKLPVAILTDPNSAGKLTERGPNEPAEDSIHLHEPWANTQTRLPRRLQDRQTLKRRPSAVLRT